MSMFSIFDIAGSALSAQSERMNVTASNLANADTTSGPDSATTCAPPSCSSVVKSAHSRIRGKLCGKFAIAARRRKACQPNPALAKARAI